MDSYAKTRSLAFKDRVLWDKRHYKLKVVIFLKFWMGLEWIFGPKCVILPILRVKTGRLIELIWTIDYFYKQLRFHNLRAFFFYFQIFELLLWYCVIGNQRDEEKEKSGKNSKYKQELLGGKGMINSVSLSV